MVSWLALCRATSAHLNAAPIPQLNFHRARVHRSRQRPRANGFTGRARNYLPTSTPQRERASGKALTLIGAVLRVGLQYRRGEIPPIGKEQLRRSRSNGSWWTEQSYFDGYRARDSDRTEWCVRAKRKRASHSNGIASGIYVAKSPRGTRLRGSRTTAAGETTVSHSNRAGHWPRLTKGIRHPRRTGKEFVLPRA